MAWHPIGWRAAWLAEIEPFPSAVLAYHYPDVPNLGDMTALPERIQSGEVPAPDVFCGGTPCQAFSVAGLRKSLDDARGNLSLTFCEIANAIDDVRRHRGQQPATIFWENVPGVLSTADNAFGCFLAGLAGEDDPLQPAGGKWTNAGAVFGPKRAVAWRILDAQYFGVAQRRRRVFVVASARAGFNPAAVLLEFDGLRRDIAPSREAGEGAARGPAEGATDSGWPKEISSTLDTTFGTKQGLEDQHVNAGCPLFVPVDVVQTLRTRRPGEGGMSADDDHLVPVISPALNTQSGSHHAPDTKAYVVQRGEGFDASEDGMGRGTPPVPVLPTIDLSYQKPLEGESSEDYWQRMTDYERAHCITPEMLSRGVRWPSPVAYTTKLHNTSSNQAGKVYEEYATSLDANSPPPAVFQPVVGTLCKDSFTGGAGGRPDGATAGHFLPVAFHPTQDPISSTDGSTHALGCGSSGGQASVAVVHIVNGNSTPETATEMAFPLRADDGSGNRQALQHGMQVRRLLPEECEALQGFPRNYTAIPWRNKPADQCPDGPRYKALGNSWAVPNVRWIGRRIDAALRLLDAESEAT